MKPPRIRVEPMRRAHLDQVMEIEESSFPDPWARGSFVQALWIPSCRALVARVGERVVGYLVAFHDLSSVEIANIAVRADLRRRGIGGALMGAILEEARSAGRRRAALKVRPSNAGALRFYEAFGFRKTGVSPGYYASSGEDAWILSKKLGDGK